MTYVALGELVLIVGLVWFIAHREDAHAKTLVELVEHQESERAELLTRIQRPEMVQPRLRTAPARARTAEEIATDKALGQIGTVAAPVKTDA